MACLIVVGTIALVQRSNFCCGVGNPGGVGLVGLKPGKSLGVRWEEHEVEFSLLDGEVAATGTIVPVALVFRSRLEFGGLRRVRSGAELLRRRLVRHQRLEGGLASL